MEQQIDKKRISLSLAACRMLRPYLPNPINDVQGAFASKIMDRMFKNSRPKQARGDG